jgi:translation initiation factor 2B subunit (eIF-2B alpha/beta/delta family)
MQGKCSELIDIDETQEDFREKLFQIIAFLKRCVAISPGLHNLFNYISKEANSEKDDQKNVTETKEKLINSLKEFKSEQIDKANELICQEIVSQIEHESTILTMGGNYSVKRSLEEAVKSGKSFNVVVTGTTKDDSETVDLTETLTKLRVEWTFVNSKNIESMDRSVSKVLLGALGKYNNGDIQTKLGTELIMQWGNSKQVPIIAC